MADKIVCLHGLETSEHPASVLQECQRVLGPGGKALFIVPNRSGMWARRDATPFGFGRPYSLSQLETQMKRHDFHLPERHAAALFRAAVETSGSGCVRPEVLEKMGARLSTYYAGGVILLEVSKRVYRADAAGPGRNACASR